MPPYARRYEVKANFKNLLRLVSHLFGVDASSFEELGRRLSSSVRSVVCEEEMVSETRGKVLFKIAFADPSCDASVGRVHQTVHIRPRHAYSERAVVRQVRRVCLGGLELCWVGAWCLGRNRKAAGQRAREDTNRTS